MIYGYIRVSTEQQNTVNQKHEISTFADKNGLQIDKWVDETISSRPWQWYQPQTKGYQQRNVLTQISNNFLMMNLQGLVSLQKKETSLLVAITQLRKEESKETSIRMKPY